MIRTRRRKATGLAAVVSILAGLMLLLGSLFAAPSAWAHHPILSGVPSCPNADHVIDWSIGNSQAKKSMSVTSAVAQLNGTNYSVDGYVNPIAPSGSTSATTTIPGTETGTVTIYVHAQWTDGHTSQRHATVDLPDPCIATTTTSPAVTTTTPTSTPDSTSTTSKVATSTTPTSPGTGGGTAGGTPQLAMTGVPVVGGILLALGCLALGLLLTGPPRRKLLTE